MQHLIVYTNNFTQGGHEHEDSKEALLFFWQEASFGVETSEATIYSLLEKRDTAEKKKHI